MGTPGYRPHLPQHREHPPVRQVEWHPPDLRTYNRFTSLIHKAIDAQINGPPDKFEDYKDQIQRLPGYPNYPKDTHIVVVKPPSPIAVPVKGTH